MLISLNNKIEKFVSIAAVIQDDRLKQLSAIKYFKGRLDFCKTNFQKIGSGSSRNAYIYDDKHVLKLAKNEKGLYQNRRESDYLIASHYSDIVAVTVDSDPDDKWIVSQIAKKITESRFKQLTKIDFIVFVNYIKNFFNYSNRGLFHISDEDKEILKNNEYVVKVIDLAGNYNLLPADLAKISSYGEIDGRAVLIDYGIDISEYNSLYRRR